MKQKGFTLMEVMISLGILGFMLSAAWFSTSAASNTKERFTDRQERNNEIRIAMAFMVRDLESAYLSANEDQSLAERRTLFVGKGTSQVDDLRFSSLGHRVLWADANESEQTLISYSAENDLEDRAMTNLVRREQRRLSMEGWKNEKAEVDVLLRDIERVSFEYYDWKENEWRENWDSTGVDAQRGRLPTRVRIKVEVRASKTRTQTITFVTQARLMMQEELRFFAN
jgi:general secretion pathway protein J